MFAHVHNLRVAWSDCDPAGIVFYPNFLAMFDVSTAMLFEAASGMTRGKLMSYYNILGWPMVRAQVDFIATASFDDEISIHSCVERLGKTSMVVTHRICRGDILCVSARETRVWAKQGDGNRPLIPEQLPELLRQQLSRHPEDNGG